MTFGEKLNAYMISYNCSPKRLVALSGVSAATISRYRAGAREPAADSEIFENIVVGLFRAAQDAGRSDVTAAAIRDDLRSVLSDESVYDADSLRMNLDMLITKLHLNSRELSSYIGMDQSTLFRIRTGQSKPAEIRAFCTDIGRYIFGKLGDDAALDGLSDILGCTPSELMTEETVCRRITGLLMGDAYSPRSYAESFLRELDGFDIDSYLAADGSPFAFANAAERQLIEAVENARSDRSAIICTDLYSGATEDDYMLKSLEYMIAALVRRGVHIDLVLNADNPMDEILPGLKLLMPVFMSGNVSAYYLKGRRDGIFRYRLISLDHAALCCEGITGHYDSVIMRFASSDDEICAYRKRAEQILSLASPLIEIIDSNEKRREILRSGADTQGKRVCVLSTPPFYTMSCVLLDRILRRNGVGTEEAERIKEYLRAERSRVVGTLRHSEYVCSFPDIERESYDENPVFLSLSGLFFDREILCTYDEYAEHIRLMREFEKEHERFCCIADKNSPFRNIQIFMHSGQWVMLSKNKTPAIHLFIKHSKLRQAFENMLAPYKEGV